MALGQLVSASEAQADADHRSDALAAFGLVLEGEAPTGPPVFHLWPECLPTWRLWREVQTQWRTALDGPTGLDYAGVKVLMDMRRTRRPRREFDLLVHMEQAALTAWSEKREQDKAAAKR